MAWRFWGGARSHAERSAPPWAALASLSKVEDATGRWLRSLLVRAHYNVVVVALAAKLARIARATLRKGESFERRPEPAVA